MSINNGLRMDIHNCAFFHKLQGWKGYICIWSRGNKQSGIAGCLFWFWFLFGGRLLEVVYE